MVLNFYTGSLQLMSHECITFHLKQREYWYNENIKECCPPRSFSHHTYKGIVYLDFLKRGETYAKYYSSLPSNKVQKAVHKKCTELSSKGVLFQQDNARSYTATKTDNYWPAEYQLGSNWFSLLWGNILECKRFTPMNRWSSLMV